MMRTILIETMGKRRGSKMISALAAEEMTKMKSSFSEKIRFERKEILVRVGFPVRNGFQFLAVIWERSPNLPEVPPPLALYLPQKQKMTFLAVICKKTPSLDLERFPSLSISTVELFRLCCHSCLRGVPNICRKNIYDGHGVTQKKFWSFKHLLPGNAKFVSWEKKIVERKQK